MEHPSDNQRDLPRYALPILSGAGIHRPPLFFGIGLAIGVIAVVCYAGLGMTDRLAPAQSPIGQQAVTGSPEEAIKTFVKLAETGQIDQMVLYYRMWERPAIGSYEEARLIRAADLEVTHRGGMLQKPVLTLAKTLNHPHLTRRKSPQDAERVDFVLGFACHCHEKEIIRVAISKRPVILSVNGEHFILPPELLYALAPFLPRMVYEGMLLHIVTQWAPEGPWHELPKDPNDLPDLLLQLYGDRSGQPPAAEDPKGQP